MPPMKIMKSIFTAFVIVGAAPVISACAGGPTQESTGQYVDSTAISAKVKAKIAEDDKLSVFSIGVMTYKDVVQLSGFVASSELKARAGRIAASVDGVQSVRNDIEIKPKG